MSFLGHILRKFELENIVVTGFVDGKRVVINNKLDWSNNISYINAKIAEEVGIICSAKLFYKLSCHRYLQYLYTFLYDILCRGMV